MSSSHNNHVLECRSDDSICICVYVCISICICICTCTYEICLYGGGCIVREKEVAIYPFSTFSTGSNTCTMHARTQTRLIGKSYLPASRHLTPMDSSRNLLRPLEPYHIEREAQPPLERHCNKSLCRMSWSTVHYIGRGLIHASIR